MWYMCGTCSVHGTCVVLAVLTTPTISISVSKVSICLFACMQCVYAYMNMYACLHVCMCVVLLVFVVHVWCL